MSTTPRTDACEWTASSSQDNTDVVTKERDELKMSQRGMQAAAKLAIQERDAALAQVAQLREALETCKVEGPYAFEGKFGSPHMRFDRSKVEQALSSPPPPVVPMADVIPLVDLLGNFLRNYEFGEKADKAMESVLQTFLAKHPTFNLTPPANS